MKNPTLTFVVPAFNAAATVADTLASITRQSRSDLEIVLVDDGSTDATRSLAESITDPRLCVVHHANTGVAGARNLGLALARGRFVTFLDADDVIEPDFAARCIDALEGGNLDQPHDAVAGAYCYADSTLTHRSHPLGPSEPDLSFTSLLETNPCAIGALVFRHDLLRSVRSRFGSAFPQGVHAEDWELLLRVTATGCRWAPPIERTLMTYRLALSTRSSGLRESWESGLSLLARWHAADALAGAQRRWTLRALGRALLEDHTLVPILARALISSSEATPPHTLLRPDEDSILRGAARAWLARARIVGATIPDAPTLAAVLAKLEMNAADAREFAASILRPTWSEAAPRVAALLRPGERLVVLGVGRNGREAAHALTHAGITFCCMDDRADATPTAPRIRRDDLRTGDVVLITPDNDAGIVRSLEPARSRGVRVVRLADLDPPNRPIRPATSQAA